jgi:hypothetical protein
MMTIQTSGVEQPKGDYILSGSPVNIVTGKGWMIGVWFPTEACLLI